MARQAVLLVLAVLVAGCAASRSPEVAAGGPGVVSARGEGGAAQPVDRLVTHRVSLRLESDDPSAVGKRAREVVEAAGGFVERSISAEDRPLFLLLRVPARELEPTLTALEATARLKEKQIVSQDVTAETVDVEARLRNLIAVRDRLRGYLDRASSVAEIIEIERELARVQGEIDALEARLEYLRSSVAMAEISLRVERPRVLGPLGLVFAGVGWTLKNLFVIR